jgi:hypothetical protein
LKRVNGSVPGYDVEAEYAVVKNIIIEERSMRAELGLDNDNWRDLMRSYAACLKGVNAVCNSMTFVNSVC